MRTLAALVLVALIVSPVLAGFGAPSEPPVFAPVPDPRPSVRPRVPTPLPVIVDAEVGVPTVRPTRPVVAVPSPRAVVRDVQSVSVRPGGGGGRSGRASWYDDGPGLYAAVNSYRWGDPRYSVRVCAGSRCVTVTVRDFCQCYVGTSRERVIDLSPDAFRRLAPLSAGLVKVTVSW